MAVKALHFRFIKTPVNLTFVECFRLRSLDWFQKYVSGKSDVVLFYQRILCESVWFIFFGESHQTREIVIFVGRFLDVRLECTNQLSHFAVNSTREGFN